MNTDLMSWLEPVQGDTPLAAEVVLLRLLAALVLGGVVAQVYRRTAQHASTGASFPVTLILLSVLIAMVTQVIGSNVARAFSLVGALSVVRFRTVVRDTRDTAYVIFAVVVGMAVGAANLLVAVGGIAIIGLASWLIERRGWFGVGNEVYILKLRGGNGLEPTPLAAVVFTRCLRQYELIGITSVKQGVGLDYVYEVILRDGIDMSALVAALNGIEGLQDVRCERRDEL